MRYLYITFLWTFVACSSAFSQVIVSSDQLGYAKRNVEQITNGKRAKNALISRANKELEYTVIPVTAKEIIPPSGDTHDYASMGPYWWPNPEKENGLPYIRRDGERNPEINKLDRNKLGRLVESVSILAYAYYFSGEEKYAFKAVDNLKIWFLNEDTKMNPNLNFGQMIPGRNGGKGRAEGIIDTYGFVELVDCIPLLASSMALSKADHQALKQWFAHFVDWLQTNEIGMDEKGAANNHGTAYDVQVAAFAYFADKNEIAKQYASNFLETRVFAQIEPDGKQPEELTRTMAMHYSIYNLVHMLDMVQIGNKVGVKFYDNTSSDGRSIKKGIEYITSFLGKPQSEFPYQQIKEWDENQDKLCWLIRRAYLIKKDKTYDQLFDQHCKTKEADINWLLYAK